MSIRDEHVATLVLSEEASDPTEEGQLRRVPGDLKIYLDGAAQSLLSGLGESSHAALRQLIHFVDSGPAEQFASGAFREVLPAGDPFPTTVTWWVSASKVDKIVELTITRNAQQRPTTEVWKVYDTDGSTVLTTVTDTIAYSGPFETTRTRAIA